MKNKKQKDINDFINNVRFALSLFAIACVIAGTILMRL